MPGTAGQQWLIWPLTSREVDGEVGGSQGGREIFLKTERKEDGSRFKFRETKWQKDVFGKNVDGKKRP